eukprot:5360822-Amphidinium_carterae.1
MVARLAPPCDHEEGPYTESLEAVSVNLSYKHNFNAPQVSAPHKQAGDTHKAKTIASNPPIHSGASCAIQNRVCDHGVHPLGPRLPAPLSPAGSAMD